MKKTMLYSLICCVFLSIAASEHKIEKLDPISIAIVLDLSDRIKVKGQIEKDKAIIQSILNEFQARQKRQGYLLSKDKLSLHIADQAHSTQSVGPSGIIMMQKKSFPEYEKLHSAFKKEVNRVYQMAINEKKSGADIYTSFCTNLPQYFRKSNSLNKIIIITDGYLLFDKEYLRNRPKCTYMRKLEELRARKNKWKNYFESEKLHLCPCDDGQLSKNISVLMLEVAGKNKVESPFEYNIINHYWSTWFSQMKIPATILNYSINENDVSAAISEFLKEK